MKSIRRFNLKTLLFALSSLLTIFSVSIIAWFSYWQLSDMLIQEFEFHSDHLTRQFAFHAFEEATAQDSLLLDHLVNGLLKEEKNLIYALVFDNNGRLLFKKHKENIDDITRLSIENTELEKPVLNKPGEVGYARHRKTRNPQLLDIWQSVIDQENTAIGYVRLGISLANIENLKRRLLYSYMIVLLAILILGFLVSFLIARSMGKSLAEVIGAMHGVILDNDLSVQLKSHSRIEETHTLISYFNQMISRLLTSRQEFSESQQRLEIAIQTIDAGLWDWNIETGVVISNDRYSTMLGYDPEEITGHISSWEKLLHPDDNEWVRTGREEYFAGKTPIFESSHRLKTKSGRWKWVQDTVKVVSWNEAGMPQRAICTQIDIDERMIAEIELSQYRRKLEDMVEEKTRELKNTQKELVNKAIESGRAQLSAMVLHNIGNAMTPVIVQVEQLQKDELEPISNYLNRCYQSLQDNKEQLSEYVSTDAKGKEIFSFLGKLIKSLDNHREEFKNALEKIYEAVNYVSEIISLQQNYAAGEKENKQLTDLNKLLDDALKMQASALEKREIRIQKDSDPDLPQLIIDKNKLMQVLVNLIKNAYEAIDELNSESGDKTINLRTFMNDDTVGFEITDTGIGIEPHELKTILQFGESGKGSSGVGLYYCKMFVESNKGDLIINSQGKGKGASIVINFET